MLVPRIAVAIALASLALTSSENAWGQKSRKSKPAAAPSKQATAAASETASSETDGKLDVSDLERKYWAAKDTDFNVVQNRLFTKAGRFALSGQYGMLINDSWSEGPTYGVNLGYFFSERYGVELAYSNTRSTDNDAVANLLQQGGRPNHNKVKQFYGAAFNWVPLYAKVSLLNSSIIYFDMSISPGIGIVEYTQQMDTGDATKTAPAFTVDVTQHYFLSNWMALRFDYKHRLYQHDIMYYKASSVPAGSERKISTDLTHDSLLMFGLTLYY